MKTECTQVTFEFHGLFQRKVKARFDGRNDQLRRGGADVAGSGVADRTVGRVCGSFRDRRDPRLIEHTGGELPGQRVYGLCLGNEDLNASRPLRTDPMLAETRGG